MTPQQTQFKADRFSNYAYAVIVPQSGASYAEQAADISTLPANKASAKPCSCAMPTA